VSTGEDTKDMTTMEIMEIMEIMETMEDMRQAVYQWSSDCKTRRVSFQGILEP
jgi:hypothetical protein